MARLVRGPAIYFVLVLLLLWVFLSVVNGTHNVKEFRIDEYTKLIHDGQIATATIYDRDQKVEGELKDGTKYLVNYTSNYDSDLIKLLIELDYNKVKVDIKKY